MGRNNLGQLKPQSGDDVVIPDGITVIINDAAKTVRSIDVQNDGSNNNPGMLKNNYPLTITVHQALIQP